MKWVAIPFSRVSSWSKDWNQDSNTAGRFFTTWATTTSSSLGCTRFSSVQSCRTLWNPMDWSTPGFPVYQKLLELTQIHVLRVSDAIQPSHPLSSPSLIFNLSQHQGLFHWVSSLLQVAKVLEFQLQYQPLQWIFRILGLTGWLSLQSKGLSVQTTVWTPTLQFKSISSSALSFLYSPTLTSKHDYWKNHRFD